MLVDWETPEVYLDIYEYIYMYMYMYICMYIYIYCIYNMYNTYPRKTHYLHRDDLPNGSGDR